MHPFIEDIKLRFQQPLPGQEAQLAMAPPLRARLMQPAPGARVGGVMILFYQELEEWYTLLIRRSEDGNVHSGQIGFPGGRMDETDPDVVFTARRECREEIGIGEDKIEVLGCLTPLYIPPSNFFVTPVLGYLRQPFELEISEREVQEVIPVALSKLFDHSIKDKRVVTTFEKTKRETPVYLINENYFIWGATAMMIAELEIFLKQSTTPNNDTGN